jgi:hypothetical protein
MSFPPLATWKLDPSQSKSLFLEFELQKWGLSLFGGGVITEGHQTPHLGTGVSLVSVLSRMEQTSLTLRQTYYFSNQFIILHNYPDLLGY